MNQPSTSDFTRLIGGALQPKREAIGVPAEPQGQNSMTIGEMFGSNKAELDTLSKLMKSGDWNKVRAWLNEPDRKARLEAKGVVADYLYYYLQYASQKRSAQSLVGDPVGVPCQESGNLVNVQQPEYGEQSSQMNQDSTRPQNQSDTVGLDERQSGDKPWGANIDTSASPSGVGGGAAWTQTGSRREAASTDQILDLFINDSFPKDKMPVWPRTGNVRIEKQYGGWALMHYNTPILFRSNEDGAPVFFNTKKYSSSTSKLQTYIKRKGGGVEVDEDTIRSEIQRANQIRSDSERTATKKSSLGKRSASQQDMRFDLNARIEVWVTADDISSDHRYEVVVKGAQSEDQKIALLKEIAVDIAREKISEAGNGVGDITAEPSLQDVNPDRIDWVSLAEDPDARDARENAEMDAQDQKWDALHKNKPAAPFTPAMGESTHNASRSRRRAMAPEELTASVEQFYHRHLAGKIGRIGTERF